MINSVKYINCEGKKTPVTMETYQKLKKNGMKDGVIVDKAALKDFVEPKLTKNVEDALQKAYAIEIIYSNKTERDALKKLIAAFSVAELVAYETLLPFFTESKIVGKSGCNAPISLVETEHTVTEIFMGDRCNIGGIRVRMTGRLAMFTVKWLEKRYQKLLVEYSPTMFIGHTMSRKQYGS